MAIASAQAQAYKIGLTLPLTALRQWGDRYLSEKPPTLMRRKTDHKPVVAALVPWGTESVSVEETELVAGPGRKTKDFATWRLLERGTGHR